jgi:ubiquinone/menaquinone biosynthesis C-methylase UbiE
MSISTERTRASTTEARRHVREMWAAVADGWEAHADFVEARGAELTQQLLSATEASPGDHVLELACGAGDVGLAAAPLVAPGSVVVSDLAAEMTAIAARRAEARGLANVTAQTFGVEAIKAGDATFDVVLCREGLMFAADPALAVREIARVLRPDGRAALAVWGPRSDNPWLGVVFDTVSTQLGRTVPPPGVPGPFSLADADALEQLLETNGLDDVAVRGVSVPLSAASFDEWWSRVATLAGPLATILAGLPEAVRHGLAGQLEEAVSPYAARDGSLRFPGLALLASGRRGSEARGPR